ncbi:hypothetical protein PTR13_24510 [Serratia bockelmannii]|uniref:hypothetical protein n=1 Tax=Serratia TaxID=613 RepID=UPI00313C03D0
MSTKKQVIMLILSFLPWVFAVNNVRAERIEVASGVTQTVNTKHNAPDMSHYLVSTVGNITSFFIILGLAVDNNMYGNNYEPSPAENCVDVRSTYSYLGELRTINGAGPSGFGRENLVRVYYGQTVRNPKPVLANIVLQSNCEQSYKANLVVITGVFPAFDWHATRALVPVTIPAKKNCYADVNSNISFGQVKANSGEHFKRIINSVGTSGNASGRLEFSASKNNLQSGLNFIWYDLAKDTHGLVRENSSKWSGPLASDYYLKLLNFDRSKPAGNYTGNLTVTLSCN